MLIRKKPKNINKYIAVDSNTSYTLHKNGFRPMYMDLDECIIYFEKNKNILKFIKDNGLQIL